MRPIVSLLVATIPRSGSWLLVEGLERTGQCGYAREYFRADYQPRYAQAWGLPASVPIGEYLEAVLRYGSTPNGIFAVKLHWGQFAHLAVQLGGDSEPELIQRTFPEARFVYLRREDKAAQAVSLFHAMQTDIWWKLDDSEDDEQASKETVDADLAAIRRLEAVLREHETQWERFFANGPEPLVIRYEQLVERYAETVQRVASFVGVPPPEAIPPPALRKQSGQGSEALLRKYIEYRDRADLRAARS